MVDAGVAENPMFDSTDYMRYERTFKSSVLANAADGGRRTLQILRQVEVELGEAEPRLTSGGKAVAKIQTQLSAASAPLRSFFPLANLDGV